MQTIQTTTTTTIASKSMLVAYLLWFFLGSLGIHRFYLGRTKSAIAILVLTLLGGALAVVGIGFILIAIVGVWLIVDIFLIPGMVRSAPNGKGLELFQTTTTTTTTITDSTTPSMTNNDSSDTSKTIE